MKNYRFLVPIVLIVLMLGSWYMLLSDAKKVDNQYKEYLEAARDFAKDGITIYAIENYNAALEIESSPEIYAEVADYYKDTGKKSEYLSWCEDFLEAYPKEAVAYEYILDAYVDDADYVECFDLIFAAEKRNVKSKTIDKIAEEIKYVYEVEFNSYEDVGVYSNNFCAVKSDGFWGFVDRYGELRISTVYVSTGAYTQSNFVSVISKDGDAYFIDKSGEKVKAPKKEYVEFGLLVDDKIATKLEDGKYIYVNAKLEKLFGEYDYASTFNGGIAAVKKGDNWQLIDANGKSISNKKYADVKLDEKQIAYRNDRLFVATSEGEYIMINGSGKQVGKLTFEDAMVFAGESPTAVKIGGKWCFVNSDGKLISDKKYDEARPFANGLAAVCIEGKWGFVDENEEIVIETKYHGAKDFNEKGSCFVKIKDDWKLLKLYRLNREG